MPPCTSLCRRPLALFALATLLSLGSAMAAQQTPPAPQWQSQTPALQSNWVVPASFRVGPGDVLAVEAYDMPELSRTPRWMRPVPWISATFSAPCQWPA